MAEWTELNETAFAVDLQHEGLTVWKITDSDEWVMEYWPLQRRPTRLKATTAEAAKLEALAIVGEWAKSLAVEAAELRGRMVGVTMNAEAGPWDFQAMIVCEICGNKRCPHATEAKWECTGSNEPG